MGLNSTTTSNQLRLHALPPKRAVTGDGVIETLPNRMNKTLQRRKRDLHAIN